MYWQGEVQPKESGSGVVRRETPMIDGICVLTCTGEVVVTGGCRDGDGGKATVSELCNQGTRRPGWAVLDST